MSTFCPLCGSAVDDGETCSCQSQGIQPVILEELIQEQTMDFGAFGDARVKKAEQKVSEPPEEEKRVQEEEKVQILSEPVHHETETGQAEAKMHSEQPQFISAQPTQVQPEQPQLISAQPTQVQPEQPQVVTAREADVASKPSVGVDIELFAPRKQSRPTPDMSFGANPMMKLDLGLDDEPSRSAGQPTAEVDIGPRTPRMGQPTAGVDIGRRTPQPQAAPAAGADIGGGIPRMEQPTAGVDIGGRAPRMEQPTAGVDIGGRTPQPQAAQQRPRRDVLREKYEQQDRMIMEKAGLLPREEEKPPEPEEPYPAEKYTAGEFFEDLKYDPVDAIENFVENGSILFAVLFILIQAVAAGVYAGVFALRYGEGTVVSGSQFMLAFVAAAMFVLLGNIILAFVEMKMLEGSSSEAYIQTLLAVISMYSLASVPCLLLAAVIALLSPLASAPFAAASWAMAIYVKGIAFGGLRDLDRNRTAVPALASCGIQGVVILLIGLMVKILMG